MANWKYTLNVKAEWQATKAGDMTLQAFAAIVLKRIDALKIADDQQLLDIADQLSDIAQDDDTDNVEWFDRVWDDLYDWGDQVVGSWNDKMCWIRTF